MAIKYSVTAKGNTGKPTEPKKYYASAKSSGEVSLRALSKEISEISTVSAADVMAVLEGFIQVVPRKLSEGNIVRMGDFGSFRTTIKAEGKNTAAEVTAKTITGIKTLYTAGAVVKDALATTEFEKI